MEFIKVNNEIVNELNINDTNEKEVYILKINNQIVGFGYILTNPQKENNIISFFIKKEHQSNGYGTILFKNLLNIIKEKGHKKIELTIEKENYKTINIIEKFNGIHISTNMNLVKYIIPIN